MARMGQCFSTSFDTVGVETPEEEMYTEEADVLTANNDYCFSDGVGRISQDLAVEVILGTWRIYKFLVSYVPFVSVRVLYVMVSGKGS